MTIEVGGVGPLDPWTHPLLFLLLFLLPICANESPFLIFLQDPFQFNSQIKQPQGTARKFAHK